MSTYHATGTKVRVMQSCDSRQAWVLDSTCHPAHELNYAEFAGMCQNEMALVTTGPAIGGRVQILGYCLWHNHPHRSELLRIAVSPAWRWCGIGRRMLERVKMKCSPQRRSTITIQSEIRNLGANEFLSQCGFWAHGLRRVGDDELLQFRWNVMGRTDRVD